MFFIPTWDRSHEILPHFELESKRQPPRHSSSTTDINFVNAWAAKPHWTRDCWYWKVGRCHAWVHQTDDGVNCDLHSFRSRWCAAVVVLNVQYRKGRPPYYTPLMTDVDGKPDPKRWHSGWWAAVILLKGQKRQRRSAYSIRLDWKGYTTVNGVIRILAGLSWYSTVAEATGSDGLTDIHPGFHPPPSSEAFSNLPLMKKVGCNPDLQQCKSGWLSPFFLLTRQHRRRRPCRFS